MGVKIDRKAGIGALTCKSCGQNFQIAANRMLHHDNKTAHIDCPLELSQPVDIYAEWIDACEAVAKEETDARAAAAPRPTRPRAANPSTRAGLAPGEKLTDEDRNFIDDEDEDAEAEYAED